MSHRKIKSNYCLLLNSLLYGLIIYKGDKTKQIPGQPKNWSFNTTLLIGIIEHLFLLTAYHATLNQSYTNLALFLWQIYALP